MNVLVGQIKDQWVNDLSVVTLCLWWRGGGRLTRSMHLGHFANKGDKIYMETHFCHLERKKIISRWNIIMSKNQNYGFKNGDYKEKSENDDKK